MAMADPNSLDDMLDEALDELDNSDDDEDENDHYPRQTVPNTAKDPIPSNPASNLPTAATATTTTTNSYPLSPPPQHSTADHTTIAPTSADPSLVFQQMLRDFMQADNHENDRSSNDDIGQFMQQVQSQLQQNETRQQETSRNDDVEGTIAAILGEMAKASLEEPAETNGAFGSSEEGQMLQEMFKSLAGGSLPEGMMNGDDDLPDMPADFNPDAFMDGMMEQLLSKELMYEPMKQVCEKFPQWLESHKEQLSAEELENRNKQFQVFQELVVAYEDESSNNKMERLMDLMQQVQEYGQPPAEIINEIAPGLELDEEGMPKMGGFLFGGGSAEDGDCTVM